MQPQLQQIEIEAVLCSDHNFAVEHAARRQRFLQRLQQIGKITVQRFLVAALDVDFVAVAKNQGAEAVPLGLEDPVVTGGQFVNALGEHRQDGRIHGKIHDSRIVALQPPSPLNYTSEFPVVSPFS